MRKIIINTKILSGKPIFEGTRIPVELVLELLAQGLSSEEILKEYPSLTKTDILSAINFAAKKIKEEKIYPISL
jgi:uncharacterized protein (DUF433 family)